MGSEFINCPAPKLIAELKTFDIQLRSIISAGPVITVGGGKISSVLANSKIND
jgi:hypothetical protein